MALEREVENWLTKFDTALRAMPMSERAELVTELKSHIVEKQSAQPDKKIEDILGSMGSPESLAATYLDERGIAAEEKNDTGGANSKSDETSQAFFRLEKDRVSLFNGAIEVDGAQGRVRIGDFIDINSHAGKMKLGPWSFDIPQDHGDGEYGSEVLRGEIPISEIGAGQLNVKMNSGKLRIRWTDEEKVAWKYVGFPLDANTVVTKGVDGASFQFGATGSGKVTLFVPRSLKVNASLDLGKMVLDSPSNLTNASVSCGKLVVFYDGRENVDIVTSVGQGKSEEVPHVLKGAGKSQVKLHVNLGKIVFRPADPE